MNVVHDDVLYSIFEFVITDNTTTKELADYLVICHSIHDIIIRILNDVANRYANLEQIRIKRIINASLIIYKKYHGIDYPILTELPNSVVLRFQNELMCGSNRIWFTCANEPSDMVHFIWTNKQEFIKHRFAMNCRIKGTMMNSLCCSRTPSNLLKIIHHRLRDNNL